MSDFVGQYFKDKDSKFTYTIDWSPYLLTGETVSSVSYSTPTGITSDTTSNTTTSSTQRVSGGTVGETYKIEVTATMSNNDTPQAHVLFTITN